MVGFFNSLDIAAAIEETKPEDRCGQGPEAVDGGYVDMLNRPCMINSLPSAIGGLSTVVTHFADRRSSDCRQRLNPMVGFVQFVDSHGFW